MTPEETSSAAEKVPVHTVGITGTGTEVTPSSQMAQNPTKFQKFMSILVHAEPLIMAGVTPFIKDQQTGHLVASEAPEAQALLEVLGNL